ncbi:PTS lactose/cellobiose transporter subunit IIA [Geosporobacter ferrireducens]|uniref:PTS cellobiose transporter subunit IIA n=1 Tax=Geosporobacter ferrireducens TaxID=1424294 RepID=A0A1D8GCI6_9FIRM|nr:PTS lactose/cellobiose transporter subunit IIA [Geosporobacter ferrireducens]AOT68623.1 hypothetical protein Gferi_02830 [Geosporobacter ferrireducens]MTI54095.1 PTS lactose/cellobiose transporter subunit IIA [Geosporobacter ferrireducens]
METIIFTIISYSGDARNFFLEALAPAKNGYIEKAVELIKQGDEKLELAHKEQTKLIQAEARGEKMEISLLMIHAQDHLMNAITVKQLVCEMIDIYITFFENNKNDCVEV